MLKNVLLNAAIKLQLKYVILPISLPFSNPFSSILKIKIKLSWRKSRLKKIFVSGCAFTCDCRYISTFTLSIRPLELFVNTVIVKK